MRAVINKEHNHSALAIKNTLLEEHSESLGRRISELEPPRNDDQIDTLPIQRGGLAPTQQKLSYKNYLTSRDGHAVSGEEPPPKINLIQDYIVHRVCMSSLSMYVKRPACCFGHKYVNVVISGEDLFKARYNFTGECDHINDSVKSLFLGDDMFSRLGVTTHIAFMQVGETEARLGFTCFGNVYHAYIIVKINQSETLIVDGAVSNYRTDKTTFLGTPEELVMDLRDLLGARNGSYRLHAMPDRPAEIKPAFINVVNYCLGNQTVSLNRAARDLFALWYGDNIYPASLSSEKEKVTETDFT